MEKLQITENLRNSLTESGVVICTYKTTNEEEVDCIDIEHQVRYPTLRVVKILTPKLLRDSSFCLEGEGEIIPYSDFNFSDTSTLEVSENRILSVVNIGTSDVNLSQSITAARPRTGVNSQNELNVVSFDGLEFLNFSNNSVISKEFTIFLVGKSNPTSNTQAFIGRYKNPAAGHWLFGRRLATNRFFTQAYSDSSSSSASDPSNNNANIHCITFKDGESISYYLNNSKRRAGTKLSGFSDNKIGLALGAANGEGLLPLKGWIGQVLIYEKLLDDTKIGKVYELLSKNWGIN